MGAIVQKAFEAHARGRVHMRGADVDGGDVKEARTG